MAEDGVTFASLNQDVKTEILSHISANEQVDLLYSMYQNREKKLMRVLGRHIINARRIDDVLGATLLLQICKHKEVKEMDMVRFILSLREIDVNLSSSFGETPLLTSLYENIDHDEMALALIHVRAAVNPQDKAGASALIKCAEKGNVNITRALIKAEANVNLINQYGTTALIWAAINGRSDIAACLLEGGANMNARNTKGYTALLYASEKGNTVALELIRAGAALNVANNQGNTALMLSAELGNIVHVKALIHAGAALNLKNKWKHTALRISRDTHGACEIVEILQAAGAIE